MKVKPLCQLTVLTLVVCNLTACGSREEVQASTVETVAAPLFMLSADGVGPLNAETPFNLIKIGNAFQDFNVIQETHLNSGDNFPVITVNQQVKPLLTINPDFQQKHIFSVIVHDNLVGNKLGHKLGAKFSEVYTPETLEQCAPGVDDWAGKVMCYAPKNSNILYLFSGTEPKVTDQVPKPAEMKDWVLEEMVWKAPAKAG
ncbi:MAG TPA: DUF1131 family protein [Thiolinea sp.]|nr:DUF1131 family protein [Thiolinea sp.]